MERRLLRRRKEEPAAGLIDLAHLAPAVTGKTKLVYEGEQEGAVNAARHLSGTACRAIFDCYFPDAITPTGGR